MAKIYAVKCGRRTGKFSTWAECEEQTKGYKGAEFKSFTNETEADRYLGIFYASSVSVIEPVATSEYKAFGAYENQYNCDEDSCIAFVDGSFDRKTNRFSYGIVLFTKDEKFCLCGCDDEPYLAKLNNVAGELSGAMQTVLKAEELGKKYIFIVHDLEGTAKWTGFHGKAWATNTRGTFEYKEFMQNHRAKIDIEFKWVKGHSGVEHNEEADRLASEAIKNNVRFSSKDVFLDTVVLGNTAFNHSR